MRKLLAPVLIMGLFAANFAFFPAKAEADNLIHEAAWDPAQNKWIVVCIQCVIGCNCSAVPDEG